jgi:hypothetical protein
VFVLTHFSAFNQTGNYYQAYHVNMSINMLLTMTNSLSLPSPKALTEALEFDPKFFEALVERAASSEKIGDKEAALEDLVRARALQQSASAEYAVSDGRSLALVVRNSKVRYKKGTLSHF